MNTVNNSYPEGEPDDPRANRSTEEWALDEWTDLSLDERRRSGARSRSLTSSLLRQASEDADWIGVLEQMVARRSVATVMLSDGTFHTGALSAIGSDFLLVDSRPMLLISLRAVAAVRPTPGQPGSIPATQAVSDRSAGLSMANMLSELAAEAPLVRMAFEGQDASVVGRLVGVGSDVATVKPESGGTPPTYVWLTSVRVVSVLLSG